MMFVVAMTTTGAYLWVLKTATGMPDWTTRVSLSSSSLRDFTIAW